MIEQNWTVKFLKYFWRNWSVFGLP